jgi:hypothetical protein
MFCANIPLNIADGHFRVLKSKLAAIINTAQKICNIEYIKIYFDGTAPEQKKKEQERRATQNRVLHFDMNALKRKLICDLPKHCGICIEYIELEQGEAEREIYINRDKTRASVLWTKDTDIYSIAYKHEPTTPNDYVFLCMDQVNKHRRLYFLYDMTKFFYNHLPVNVFRFIVAMAGTDFTPSMFSPTMIKAIVNAENTNELNPTEIELLNEALLTDNGPELAIEYFINFFNTKKCFYTKEYKINPRNIPHLTVLWYIKYYLGQPFPQIQQEVL